MDEPIPGPQSNLPDYPMHLAKDRFVSPVLKFSRFFADLVRTPAHWIRENIVEKNRGPKYYWYHRKFEPALPVDECYNDDIPCIYEATLEMRRDALVDRSTLFILKHRKENCKVWHAQKKNSNAPYYMEEKCKDIEDVYIREEINFMIKYGDLHWNHSALNAYTKQKHRLIHERRQKLLEQQMNGNKLDEKSSEQPDIVAT